MSPDGLRPRWPGDVGHPECLAAFPSGNNRTGADDRAPGSLEVTAIRTRARRAILALLGAVVVAALVPLPASADESTISGSWFNAAQPEPQPPPIGTPAPVPTPDVPPGDFAVSAKPGQQSDKETFFHVDVSSVAPDATFTGLTIKLQEDSAGRNVQAGAATIDARLVTEFFADGAAGSPYSQRPKVDTASVRGARSPDGLWTFDIGSLVKGKPVSSFFGVAAQPAPATATDAFEVVWTTKGAIATFTVAGSSSSAPGAAPVPGAFASTPTTTRAASGSTASGSASTGGGAFLPTPQSPAAATTSGSGSEVAAAPLASTPAAGATPAVPAAAAGAKRARSDHGLPWVFLPAALAVVVLLGGASVALGEAGEPVPDRQGSVVRRLERPADAVG